MIPHLLLRRKTHFILWRPGEINPPPSLYIGQFPADDPGSFQNFQEIPLTPNPEYPELWEVAAANCQLQPGGVYHYWFKVTNTSPYNTEGRQILYCTDPLATTVDRRPLKLAPKPNDADGIKSNDPASVILYQDGQLIPCNSDGKTGKGFAKVYEASLVANNHLVMYKLPTRWTRTDIGTGLMDATFQDMMALLNVNAVPPNFPDTEALGVGQAYLLELGVNALECLPLADSEDPWQWGYGTANFLAVEDCLGCPEKQEVSSSLTDLEALVALCHQQGVRFFLDLVLSYAMGQPYRNIKFADFFVQWGIGDPEQNNRDGFGGDLLKYNYWVKGYEPLTGERDRFVPGRELIKVAIAHWMEQYHIDGIRLDSVNNIANYDFIQEIRDFAHGHWQDQGKQSKTEHNPDHFLVVGQDSNVSLSLIHQNRLDGLWNENFKQIVRQVILGENAVGDSSFEWSLRKLIDCNYLGFTDGTQAVNYLTSPEVGGVGNERLYNYLSQYNIPDLPQRIKLAFVCLLTAVGIPLILAGEEFADEHDLNISDQPAVHRQIDPVNYQRVNDPWRKDIFNYVARLVHLRTTSPALAINDTWFLHADYTEGKRVVAWQRGRGDNLVIVVANFSDYGTPNPTSPEAEYIVPNWRNTPPGKQWREVTQDRIVPPEWVGREPIFPWEAKVYVLE
ncbi:alpha-amylase family glycosyl hydrolase [Spirulina sp. CS-785/01]|uniref:alpha-amylase family glycosyl hydrolase n=1 Tax=Spirulina sp. CS-785/01 TaxID=3021716 RepID=UPI00232EAAB9|nr:alpha-amylase family glycosyl hydrolase [Spirulina sp. CS-785/01]MDB9311492.1 alpha-amylase family glycosyl hydrolase [Spirulina sp. CS-785/01]